MGTVVLTCHQCPSLTELLCPAAPVPVDPFVGYERHELTASRLVMGQEALTKLGPSVQWRCNTDEDAVPVVCPPPTEHRLPWSGEALHPPNALTTTIYDSLGRRSSLWLANGWLAPKAGHGANDHTRAPPCFSAEHANAQLMPAPGTSLWVLNPAIESL